MSALCALTGYVAGAMTATAVYFLYDWFERSYREIDERDEITRILDLIGMDDELYVKFNASHLPYLRALEVLSEHNPSTAVDFVPALAAILIIPTCEFEFTECRSDMAGFYRPDKFLNAAKELAELKFDTLTIKSAASALHNYEKYAKLLGDSVNAVSLYLSHPEFDSIMSKVIFENDHCVSHVMEFIINQLNLVAFKTTIAQASQMDQLSPEDFNTLMAMAAMFSQILDHLQNTDGDFLKLLASNACNISTHTVCGSGCTAAWPDLCQAVRAYQELPNHKLFCRIEYLVNNTELAEQLQTLNADPRIRIITDEEYICKRYTLDRPPNPATLVPKPDLPKPDLPDLDDVQDLPAVQLVPELDDMDDLPSITA